MLKQFLNGVVILLFATSCKAQLPLIEKHEREITHSVTLRDTAVSLEADSSMVMYSVKVDDNKQIELTQINKVSGKVINVPELAYDNGILTLKAVKPPQQVTLTIKDSYTYDNLTITQIERIETNRLTWWQTTQLWTGRLLGGFMLLYIGLLVLRQRAWI